MKYVDTDLYSCHTNLFCSLSLSFLFSTRYVFLSSNIFIVRGVLLVSPNWVLTKNKPFFSAFLKESRESKTCKGMYRLIGVLLHHLYYDKKHKINFTSKMPP